uniref:RIN4 pathogenic type III effector avirulence factor Avr cleavage site domain-containing protein n=1 Tax=Kalanchoe fedtschenkoi TaxID=63787 RepID=A0A7N0TIP8_KALFE
MENRRERNGRMSVPQFGAWDNQGSGFNPADGYTVVFTKARQDRKEQKSAPIPTHLATPADNNTPPQPHHRRSHHHHHCHHQDHTHSRHHSDDEAMGKKNFLTYLNCCIKP